MNFLQLCQKVRRQGAVSGTGPASVLNQTGDYSRIVEWVNDAWRYIQTDRRWNWMQETASLNTVASTRTYTVESDCDFIPNDIRCYLSSDGSSSEYWLKRLPYSEFNRAYLYGDFDAARPLYYTIAPDNELLLHPVPDDVYVVSYQYYRVPSDLSGNTGTPELPTKYHDLIVYKALTYLAEYESDMGLLQMNMQKFDDLYRKMQRDELEEFSIQWRPLA